MSRNESGRIISGFVDDNIVKIAKVVKQYPISIPTEVAAGLLGISVESMRVYLQNGGELGVAWLKKGKQNYGYSIPTFAFLCKCFGRDFINIVKEYI